MYKNEVNFWSELSEYGRSQAVLLGQYLTEAGCKFEHGVEIPRSIVNEAMLKLGHEDRFSQSFLASSLLEEASGLHVQLINRDSVDYYALYQTT